MCTPAPSQMGRYGVKLRCHNRHCYRASCSQTGDGNGNGPEAGALRHKEITSLNSSKRQRVWTIIPGVALAATGCATVGDLVEGTYTEASAVSVDKPVKQ